MIGFDVETLENLEDIAEKNTERDENGNIVFDLGDWEWEED